jgi:hypothetical protein
VTDDGLDDDTIMAALVGGTGLDASAIDLLLRPHDSGPVPKLRTAILEDIKADPDVAESGAMGKAVWCLAQSWHLTSDLVDFSHDEINGEALVAPIVALHGARRAPGSERLSRGTGCLKSGAVF